MPNHRQPRGHAAGAAASSSYVGGTSVGASLVLRGVGKAFGSAPDAPQVLAGLSLEIPSGRIVSVIGPSGGGKTTLLMLMAGLERATEGAIYLGGEEICGPYEGLGIVFQHDLLLRWRTAIDNVLLPIELVGLRRKDFVERAFGLLDLVGLAKFEHHYPGQLSGGMRQRVAVARALIQTPRVLLMDEPFGAVDALQREQLNVDIGRICQEARATTVVVTHSMEEAVFMADEVVILSQRPARIVETVTVDLERPRHLAARSSDAFRACVSVVRATFEREGVLRG